MFNLTDFFHFNLHFLTLILRNLSDASKINKQTVFKKYKNEKEKKFTNEAEKDGKNKEKVRNEW